MADKFIVIVDESKLCDGLGPGFPLPVEITPFCHEHTMRLVRLDCGGGKSPPRQRRLFSGLFAEDGLVGAAQMCAGQPRSEPQWFRRRSGSRPGRARRGASLGKARDACRLVDRADMRTD